MGGGIYTLWAEFDIVAFAAKIPLGAIKIPFAGKKISFAGKKIPLGATTQNVGEKFFLLENNSKNSNISLIESLTLWKL